MSRFVCTIILLQLGIFFSLAYTIYDSTLYNDCPSFMCGDLEIRFPYNLENSSQSCRKAGISANLSCSATNETTITLPSSESYRIQSIDYYSSVIVVQLSNTCTRCPWPKGNLKIPDVNGSMFNISTESYFIVSCTTKQSHNNHLQPVVCPITCPSEIGSFLYANAAYEKIHILPPSCIQLYSVDFPCSYAFDSPLEGKTVALYSNSLNNRTLECERCLENHENCGYNTEMDEIFCYPQDFHYPRDFYYPRDFHYDSHRLINKGIAIRATLMILLIAAVVGLYFFKTYTNEKKKRMKVENFLMTYKSTALTRYKFANIKKITKKFKHKLGQGGFGSVYKGELNNGIPVAVKMLEASKSNGEDFINEVATIGKIHHVNIVRLLGFCSDGTNRALVYEFMPNESLEKFIFLGDLKKKNELFSIEKLQEIAIGIAQGIDYLHQGCNQRIVHFDIKPHNILLDYDFNPKISDFGLAKLCSREQSIVTISAARGTMGYMAPEVYSRNFGPISHKADVYSYGMLLIEMIGRRKIVDPTIDNFSEIYFPEWIYNRLFHSTNLGLAIGMGDDEEIMKKLAIIALWCIQWNPAARPSMTKVVRMLTSHIQSLEIPPKPFVSSSDQLGNVNISTNHEEILKV